MLVRGVLLYLHHSFKIDKAFVKSPCSVVCHHRVSCSYFSLEVTFVFCERGDKEEIPGKFLSVSRESRHHTPVQP